MSFIDSVYVVFLATGFTVGFGHCLGMCGPIVIAISLNLKHRPSFIPQLYYNLGRTFTYGLLGAAAGATASFVRLAENVGGLQKAIMIFAGVAVMVMGAGMTGWIPAGRIFQNAPAVSGIINRCFKRLISSPHSTIFLFLGMPLGLLPCGPVYTAMIAAARTGMEAKSTMQGLFSGFLVMVSFGLGTIPALFLLSQVSHVKWLKHRELIYKFGGVIMIGMGIYFMWKGFLWKS